MPAIVVGAVVGCRQHKRTLERPGGVPTLERGNDQIIPPDLRNKPRRSGACKRCVFNDHRAKDGRHG